jgi:hypothetical protein
MIKLKHLLLLAIILFPLVAFIGSNVPPAHAQGWLTGWGYRKSHVVNSATGAGTNYQVKVVVHYGTGTDSGQDVYLNSHSRTDFGDVRFTRSDGTTLLDYWIESYTASNNAVFWVEVADDLSTNPVTIYVYYGKSDATTTSNGDATFLLFDDFDDNALNTSKWTTLGQNGIAYSETNQQAKFSGTATNQYWVAVANLLSVDSFTPPFAFRVIKVSLSGSGTGRQITQALYSSDSSLNTYYIGYDSGYYWRRKNINGVDSKIENIASSELGTQRTWEITAFNGQTKWYEDGTLKSTDSYSWSSAKIRMEGRARATNDAVTAIFDTVVVRKYVSPEPSHGVWGSEETAPSPNQPYPPTLTGPANLTRFNPSASVNFTWIFSHSNQSEHQSAFRFQLDDSVDFSSPNVDTGKVQSTATWTLQTLPSAVGLYYWHVCVWDSQDLQSGYSNAWTVIVDRVKVYALFADDSRRDVGTTVTLTVQLVYEYDNGSISSGSFTLNGLALSYQSGSTWTATDSKSAVTAFTYNSVSGTEGVYGLTTVNMNGQSATVVWDRLEVYGFGVSKSRLNVGDYSAVWVKLRYSYDAVVFDNTKGSVSIGGVSASWDATNSRWYINETRSSVGKVDYSTPSSFTDNTYGLTAISGSTVQSVIWDSVLVESSGAVDGRVNVGGSDTVYFVLKYEYDLALVSDGSVLVNGSAATYSALNMRWELNVSQSTVCSKCYYVSAVSGNLYGITVINHQASYPQVIWDRVKVESGGITPSSSRVNVGSSVKVYFVVKYEFDGSLVTDGVVQINGSSASYNASAGRWELSVMHDSVGNWSYGVSGVSGNLYGITVWTDSAGFKSCVWDRIQFYDGGVTGSRVDVGSFVYVWFKARYEYDQAPFNGSVGSVYINGSLASWESVRWTKTFNSSSVAKLYFVVTGVVDNVYGLTAYVVNVGTLSTIFDKVLCTLSVADDRINIGSTAQITIVSVYAYDNTPFHGYVRVNDTDFRKTTAGKYGFTISAVSDSLYGLTVFESNAVSVIWDGLSVDQQHIDLESLVVCVHVKYAYDGLSVANAKVSYGGVVGYTNSSGWATFSVWNISSVAYGSGAYASEEPVYNITFCSQSLSVQFAKQGFDTLWLAGNSAISDFYWDWTNRKLSFRMSGTAVAYVPGLGSPQKVEVNRQTWGNWTYDASLLRIYNLSSYVVVSWVVPPTPPEQPQEQPYYVNIFSLGVDVVDLGSLAPGSTVNFTIALYCNQTAKIVNVEFASKAEWFKVLDQLPLDVVKGNSTIRASLSVPPNIQGVYSIPFSVTGMIEGTSLTANSYVKFTVGTAAQAGFFEQFMAYLSDPLVILLLLLTLAVVAASRRR